MQSNASLYYGLSLLTLLSPISELLANEAEIDSLSSYEIYAGAKGYYYHKLTPFNAPHNDADDARVFIGLKYNSLINQNVFFDTDVRAVYQYRNGLNPLDEERASFLEVKKFKLVFENVFDSPYWKAEVGRKRIASRNSWLYDDEIEFIEFSRQSTLLELKGFYAKWLWDGRFGAGFNALDDEQRIETSGSSYLGLDINYTWYYQHKFLISYLFEDFNNPRVDEQTFSTSTFVESSRLNWLRLALHGAQSNATNTFEYWLDVAFLRGKRDLAYLIDETSFKKQSIKLGKALRLGIKWFPDESNFSLMAAFDTGSGDTQFKQDSNLFVQPYIASNRTRLLGRQKRRMYGEVLAPRLSNLSVYSFATAYQFSPENWLELAAYKYQQNKAESISFQYRDNLLPNGQSKEIGWGVDLSWFKEFRNDLLVETTVGFFHTGDAFNQLVEKKNAHRIYLNLIKRW